MTMMFTDAMNGFVLDGRQGKTLDFDTDKNGHYWIVRWEDGSEGKIYTINPEFQRMITPDQHRINELESTLQALVDEIRLADLYNMDQSVLQRVKSLGIKVRE